MVGVAGHHPVADWPVPLLPAVSDAGHLHLPHQQQELISSVRRTPPPVTGHQAGNRMPFLRPGCLPCPRQGLPALPERQAFSWREGKGGASGRRRGGMAHTNPRMCHLPVQPAIRTGRGCRPAHCKAQSSLPRWPAGHHGPHPWL